MFLLISAAVSFAQDLQPFRIRIRHADPWYVKAMLEGRPLVTPEIGTLMGFMGSGAFAGEAVNALFQGGTLMVSPADNTLWFIPANTRRR
ncbi:MAG TPA: hypothetical protein VGE01_09860 [Fimbriimonas sp.]